MGDDGDRLEENLGALLRPDKSDWEATKSLVELGMAIGGEIPVVGIAIKVIAWQRAWYGDAKKADRVRPVWRLGRYRAGREL